MVPSAVPSLKSVSLVTGPDVQLINISRGGALFQTNARILPGAGICIRLVATDALFFLRGRVLQSQVSSSRGSELHYECRVAFDEEFSLPEAERENHPAPAIKADVSANSDAGDDVELWPGVLEEGPNSILTITVPVPRLECDLPSAFGL